MTITHKRKPRRIKPHLLLLLFIGILSMVMMGPGLNAQDKGLSKKLEGLDAYMAKILKDAGVVPESRSRAPPD